MYNRITKDNIVRRYRITFKESIYKRFKSKYIDDFCKKVTVEAKVKSQELNLPISPKDYIETYIANHHTESYVYRTIVKNSPEEAIRKSAVAKSYRDFCSSEFSELMRNLTGYVHSKLCDYVMPDEDKIYYLDLIKRFLSTECFSRVYGGIPITSLNYTTECHSFYNSFSRKNRTIERIFQYMLKDRALSEKLFEDIFKDDEQTRIVYEDYNDIFSLNVVRRKQFYDICNQLFEYLKEQLSEETFCDLIDHNPIYKKIALEAKEAHDAVIKNIPENYIDLYPFARKYKRHFIIHLGPTNSGKTYDAIQALKAAPTGIYLAPLRLLAYEIFEKLNDEKVPCCMVTGEENIQVPNAKHLACTIEMVDTKHFYDVAVIDEAQMINDEQRGGSWTSAMLGVAANTIHVCCAPNAKNVLIAIIEQCGDTYEISAHHRTTELKYDNSTFVFPDCVKKNDAIIVFSKASVLGCAAELQKAGFKTSVIYGALPYDARRKEVERFIQHETDVVVATDAIGMGLNLPVQRIVFLESDKFDGKSIRPLRPEEVRQIAGRAGRRGIYNVGYYIAPLFKRDDIKRAMAHKVEEINFVRLRFPETLVSIDYPLSDTIQRWGNLPNQSFFIKEDTKTMLSLCKELESRTDNNGDKTVIYKFITIPFDPFKPELKYMWLELFDFETGLRRAPDDLMDFYFGGLHIGKYKLETLELLYKKCDLLYSYLFKFNYTNNIEKVMDLKNTLSDTISEMLAKQNLSKRKCKRCGRELSWSNRYSICESCYYTGFYR